MNSTTNRSTLTLATFSVFSALLFSIVISLFQVAQATPIRGENVTSINVEQGSFRQIGPNRWVEKNRYGQTVFSFKETKRNTWSVYLYDRSREVRLTLDMYRNVVGYSDANNPKMRDLYRITSSSAKPSGWIVKQVKFNKGAFIYRGHKNWVETGTQNEIRFNFKQVGRSKSSVFLKDYSRNVSIQLNLHTRKVMYHAGNDPQVPLYHITYAR